MERGGGRVWKPGTVQCWALVLPAWWPWAGPLPCLDCSAVAWQSGTDPVKSPRSPAGSGQESCEPQVHLWLRHRAPLRFQEMVSEEPESKMMSTSLLKQCLSGPILPGPTRSPRCPGAPCSLGQVPLMPAVGREGSTALPPPQKTQSPSRTIGAPQEAGAAAVDGSLGEHRHPTRGPWAGFPRE